MALRPLLSQITKVSSLALVITHEGTSGFREAGGPRVSWNQQRPSHDWDPAVCYALRSPRPAPAPALTLLRLTPVFLSSHPSSRFSLTWNFHGESSKSPGQVTGSTPRPPAGRHLSGASRQGPESLTLSLGGLTETLPEGVRPNASGNIPVDPRLCPRL